ncbi:MAG: FecR domain-containing protein [Bacteroidales bacterium]
MDFIYDPASNNSKVLNVKFNTKESLEQVLDVLIGLTDFDEYRIYGRKVYLK